MTKQSKRKQYAYSIVNYCKLYHRWWGYDARARDNLLMENRDLGQYGMPIRKGSKTQISRRLVRPSLIMQSHNRFETLHITRKCHCRALSKISQRRLGNRIIHVHFMRVENWVSNGNQTPILGNILSGVSCSSLKIHRSQNDHRFENPKALFLLQISEFYMRYYIDEIAWFWPLAQYGNKMQPSEAKTGRAFPWRANPFKCKSSSINLRYNI